MLKVNEKFKFNLQLFAEEEQNEPEDNKGGKGAPTYKNEEEEKAPFAIFPDQESFMARVKREAKKLNSNSQKEFLTSLGVESAEDLQSILADHKKRKDNEKSELDKAIELANAEKLKNATLQAQFESQLKDNAVKEVASTLGVSRDKLGRFTKLVDTNSISIADGKVDTDTLKDDIQTILDEFPEFKGITPVPKGGTDIGGEDKDKGKKKLTIEDIKNMTTAEIQANMKEVMEVLGSK